MSNLGITAKNAHLKLSSRSIISRATRRSYCLARSSTVQIPTIRSGINQKEKAWRRLRRASGTWASRTTMSRTLPSGLSTTPCMHTARKWCVRAGQTVHSKRANISAKWGKYKSVGSHRRTDQAQTMKVAEGERYHKADARRIIAMRGLRSFAYGMLAVILGIALTDAGFSPSAIGILITVSLLGDFFGTYVIGIFADHFGRRRTLTVLAL